MSTVSTAASPVYKCGVCGNVVELLRSGGGTLVCCEEPMELLAERQADAGREKHQPVIKILDDGVKVAVGAVSHPMEEKHFIEWIELIADGQSHRQRLHPGDEPAALFHVKAEKLVARSFCNLHGLWKSE